MGFVVIVVFVVVVLVIVIFFLPIRKIETLVPGKTERLRFDGEGGRRGGADAREPEGRKRGKVMEGNEQKGKE